MIQKSFSTSKAKLSQWLALRWRQLLGLAPQLRRVLALAARRPLVFWSGTAAIVLGLAGAGFAWNTVSTIGSVERDASQLLDSVREGGVTELTSSESYSDLISRIETLEEEVGNLNSRAQLLQVFQWVPGLGTQIREARLFLETGLHFARGSRAVLQGYTPVVQALGPSGTQADLLALRENLETAAPLFQEALTELAKARESRERLGTPDSLGDRMREPLELIDQYVPLVELAAVTAIETPELVGEVLSLRDTLSGLRVTLSEPAAFLENPETLRVAFADVEERARRIQEGILRVKSAIGSDNEEANQALDTALQTSMLLANLGEGLGRFASVADDAFTLGLLSSDASLLLGNELPEIKRLLVDAQVQLEQLNETILSSTGEGDGISLLSVVSVAVGSPTLPLQREEALLATGVQTVDFLMYFLGHESPKKYLLVGQNDDEIRATGGFIGVVAELTVDQGDLTGLIFYDSTTVDSAPYDTNPLPPEAVYRYLWMARLLFRDGNWNPDFPTSAAQLADIYERSQGQRVDGVLAATEEVVLDLVDALGGVRVPDVPELLDRDLAEQYVEGELEYACLPRHVSKRGKRCFDENLFHEVLDRLLTSIPPESRDDIVQVFLNRLRSKDILLHVFDAEAAELLWERDWNGALKQVDHDYLMVVDSSLPGHARSVVERKVQYQVELSLEQPIVSELLVEYEHKGQGPDPDCRQALSQKLGCYWNFLRVYIPVLTRDIQAPPVPLHEGSEWLIWGYEPADSLTIVSSSRGGQAGLTEIGAYLVVEPQTSVILPLRYSLPASVVRNIGGGVFQYRLLVQKQPGTPIEPVTVFVKMPPGGRLLRSSPGPTAQEGDWVRMDVDLTGDTTFTV